jgi:hypothetical protein
VSSSDPVTEAKEYARNKYASACDEITRQSQQSLVATQGQLAARGLANSGPMAQAVGENHADLVKKLIQARVDALIDGFELYGIPITEELTNFIIREATQVRENAVVGARKMAGSGMMNRGVIVSNIVDRVNVPVPAIRCQIEERRVKPKMTPQTPNVTNVYHVSGDNSRVNVQSTDQSVNVVITSSEQLFQKIRESIQSGVPGEQRTEILARLEALEKAQNSASFGVCYKEFIAAAANHMTLLGPFIPALSELLHKML